MRPLTGLRRALVTGASSGIGEEFCRQLAARGLDLVLVARRAGPLEELAASVTAGYGVQAEVLPADLLADDQRASIQARLAAEEDPVDLLVSAAGVGAAGSFVELSRDDQTDLTRLHGEVAIILAHAALPRMVAAGRGALVTISSVAGIQPVPGGAVYGAAKAFLLSFTESLHEELRGTGVAALAVCPGHTPTGFHARAGIDRSGVPPALTTPAEQVVAEALTALARGRAVCVPGAPYRVAAAASRLAPRVVATRVAGAVQRGTGRGEAPSPEDEPAGPDGG